MAWPNKKKTIKFLDILCKKNPAFLEMLPDVLSLIFLAQLLTANEK